MEVVIPGTEADQMLCSNFGETYMYRDLPGTSIRLVRFNVIIMGFMYDVTHDMPHTL